MNSEASQNLYATRDIESLDGYYMLHLDHMTTEELHNKSDIAAELAWRDAQIAALENFKSYVHARLDEAGIPADPESPHKAEGCRIGGRLDIVLARYAAAEELLTACKTALSLLTKKPDHKEPMPMPDEPGFKEIVTADCNQFVAQWDAAESMLQAAIAKAEGRSL